ncbi:MAG: hypothetical protein Unbinned5079contig1000_44 [Prokaryotic dsDNA virus sp.]|nr:MAG: hypothetical protein Unbinned5079contig1000_44 [Prokaryotic dsDNA virus sp.]|tara:strand:- start:5502 stop:7229 length:1728 start_codon:yes stop_codon:yes gene_type:complete
MVDMYIPEQEEDENLTQQYHDYAKAGTMDVLGATFNETLYYNPANALGRLSEQYIGKGTEGSTLSKDAWASSDYFREGIEVGEEGIKEGLAQLLSERHDERLDFRTTLGRSRGGFGLGAAQFGVSLAGSMLDPLNVASSFIPSVALGRMATTASRTGSKRFMTGAMDGAVGAAIVEPLVIGAAAAEQDRDYRLMDSFLNVAVGAALGGSLFYGVGKLSDRLRKLPPKSKEQAQNTAIGQVLQDQEVNVTSVVRDGEAVASARAEKVANEVDKTPVKSPFDEDYEVEDIGTGEVVSVSTINDAFLKASVKEFDARIKSLQPYAGKPESEIASDALKIQKLKTDKKAIEVEMDRRSGKTIERPTEPDVEVEAAELTPTKFTSKDVPIIIGGKPSLDPREKIISITDGTTTRYLDFQEDDGFGGSGWVEVDRKGDALPQVDQPRIYAEKQKQRKQAIQDIQNNMLEKRQTVTQQQADAPVTEAQEVQPEPSNLGRLAEYSDDVDEIKSQSLKQDEFDANAIEQENQVLLSEVTTEENLAMLPAEARQSLEEITDLEASAENIENYVEAGRACIVRSQG